MTPANRETAEALRTAAKMLEAVQEAIESAGSMGIPSGTLYAMMNGFGCSLEIYNYLINALLETGKITQQGNVLRGVAR